MNMEYIWEASYEKREAGIKAMKVLLDEQPTNVLQGAAFYVDNNPYNFEFYILVSYSTSSDAYIERMKEIFTNWGIKYRPDLTNSNLLAQLGNRRFNVVSFVNSIEVETFGRQAFEFPGSDELEKAGYIIEQISKDKKVFISHSSNEKKKIKELIPYLNGENHPVWIDEYSIGVGESLEEQIKNGIIESHIILFWVTKDFLSSQWCLDEIKWALENQKKAVYFVESDIKIKSLPSEIKGYKYESFNKKEKPGDLAKKIVTVIKNIS